jgi:hypothetical protein
MDSSFDSDDINGGIALVGESELKAANSPKKYRCLDDEVLEDMQRQMHITDPLKSKSIEEITDEDLDKVITPQHKESVRKKQELLND